MSNPCLLSELVQRSGEEVVLKNQYRVGLALAAAIYYSLKTTPSRVDSGSASTAVTDMERLKEDLHRALRGVSMIILPMINTLATTVRSIAAVTEP